MLTLNHLSLSILSSSSPLSFFSPPSKSSSSSFNGIHLPLRTSIPPLTKHHARATSSSSSSVVMMAKRELEIEEIRKLTTDQINEEVVDLKGDLLMLRLQKSSRNEFKPSEFGRMRKRIARMLTVKREREIKEGINKRLSRKLDKKWKKNIVVRPSPLLKKLREEEAAEEAAEAEKAT